MTFMQIMRSTFLIFTTYVLSVMFVMLGAHKLLESHSYVETFNFLDLPAMLIPIVGIMELAGGLLISIRQTRWHGAATIMVLMVAVNLAHLFAGINSPFVIVSGVIGLLAFIISYVTLSAQQS